MRRVIEVQELAPSIRCLSLRQVKGARVVFEPGQFIQVWIDRHGERVGRSYSIASQRGNLGEIDIIVSSVKDGIVTANLFCIEVGVRWTNSVRQVHGKDN